MLTKNQEFVGTVEGLGSRGEGIVCTEGVTFFVPYVLPGEKIRFKSLKVKDSIGYGKCEEVLVPSHDRVTPPCPVFEKCGGCQLQHVNYSAQLSFKRELVKNTLKKIGNVEYDVPMPVASDKNYGYRNKLQLPVGVDNAGNTVVGFYAERSHRIVPIDGCAIHPDWATRLIAAIKEYIAENGIQGYDEVRKTGSLRHVVVRDMGGKFIVAVVSRESKLKNAKGLIEKLKGALGEFTLVFNVNTKDTNVIFGDKFTVLYGDGFFDAEENGVIFEAGAQTFVQVNEGIRGKLYERALEMVAGTGEEVVADCYSGAGLLTAMVAKRAKRVYGIELERESSLCAERLKEKNGLSNMYNICGKVEEKLPDVIERERGEKLRLILDPPRAGIHRSVLKAIISSGIEKLVLISCNPATLARDLGLLTGTLTEDEKGQLIKGDGCGAYTLDYLQPFDMFPNCAHVETVCLLFRLHTESTPGRR